MKKQGIYGIIAPTGLTITSSKSCEVANPFAGSRANGRPFTKGELGPHRLMVRTSAFQAGNRSSTLRGVTRTKMSSSSFAWAIFVCGHKKDNCLSFGGESMGGAMFF